MEDGPVQLLSESITQVVITEALQSVEKLSPGRESVARSGEILSTVLKVSVSLARPPPLSPFFAVLRRRIRSQDFSRTPPLILKGKETLFVTPLLLLLSAPLPLIRLLPPTQAVVLVPIGY